MLTRNSMRIVLYSIEFTYKIHVKWLPKINFVLETILFPSFQSLFYILIANYLNNSEELIYFIIGSLCVLSIDSSISGVSTLISSERRFGTVDNTITSSFNSSYIFLGRILYWCLLGYISFVSTFLILCIFFNTIIFSFNTFLIFSAFYIILCLANSGIGYMIGIVALVKRNVLGLSEIISSIIILLSGAYFSVDILPNFAIVLSKIVPLTYGVKAVRIILDNGLTLQCLYNIFGCLSLGLLYFIIGVVIYNKIEKNIILNSNFSIF